MIGRQAMLKALRLTPRTDRFCQDASNPNSHGASAAAIGAAGGNVGFLDGSVAWKSIKQMQTYRGSQQWGDSGCWAMW